MDKLKPETDGDFEKGASLKAVHANNTPADGSAPSDAKPLQDAQAGVFALHKPQTLGQYMVGDVLTKKEAILSWTGVAIMFFVVLVPTTNQTILAYFTKQLQQDCGLTIAQYGLLSGYANGLVYAFSSLILGWCVDRLDWPRTWLLVAANLLLAGMYVLEGLATNFGMLLAAVMIAAVGGSVHLTLSISLVSDLLPPKSVSLGQALIFTGEAVAVILGGNLAFAFKASGISWRAAPFGLAIVAFMVAIAIAVLIREPKKGRFIVQQEALKGSTASGKDDFRLGEALAYLANMRTFWMITVGVGIRMNGAHLLLGYMPPFQGILYPQYKGLDATFATIVGVCAFASSVIIGWICERQIAKRPWISLYLGAFGGLIGMFFFVLAIWAKPVAMHGNHSGYGLMLACVGVGALVANGANGPLAALQTLLLPPEIKSFALSVYEFVSFLIGPSYSVVMGVGLQAFAKKNMARFSGVSPEGTGPSSNLDGGKKTFVFAMVMLCVGLIIALLGSAAFFLWASWGVRHDIMKQKKRADGTAEPEKVPLYRKVLLISGMLLLLLAVFFLLAVSLVASFHPKAVQGGGAHG